MRLASFDIFDTTLIRLFGRPENINVLLAGKEHSQGDALEREVESACLIANPEVRDIIQQKRQEGWQIAFISDMYLDSEFLSGILKREGCMEDGDKIYVSCEHNARKDTGTLYDVVRKDLQPEEWEHYGDNKQSDVMMAERKGIKVHFIDNSYRDLASRFVAPAYIPYVLWLIEEAKKQDIQRLYFISRDGYILQQIADALPHDGIELKYFFTSRKALQKAFENKEDRQLTIEYFQQEGLMDDCTCAMVDVGWLGTSRKMINQLLVEQGVKSVHFFYFGTTRNVLAEEHGSYQSYLSAGFLPYYMQLLVEHYFSASPYPTTLGYQRNNDRRIAPFFPDGEQYCETKIMKNNIEVCLKMIEAFQKIGIPSANVLRQWAEDRLTTLTHKFFYTDFSPLQELPKFEGQDFVRKLSINEILLMASTGQHITVFDKGSLAMTFKHLRVQKFLWTMHCQTGKVRSWLYQILWKRHSREIVGN